MLKIESKDEPKHHIYQVAILLSFLCVIAHGTRAILLNFIFSVFLAIQAPFSLGNYHDWARLKSKAKTSRNTKFTR